MGRYRRGRTKAAIVAVAALGTGRRAAGGWRRWATSRRRRRRRPRQGWPRRSPRPVATCGLQRARSCANRSPCRPSCQSASWPRSCETTGVEVIKELMKLGIMATSTSRSTTPPPPGSRQALGWETEPRRAGRAPAKATDFETRRSEAEHRPGGRARARRSSRSWATSTTARPSCSTRSARPMWPRARPAASPSTSAPTRSRPRAARSPSSTPRATRRSPPCAPAARRRPTSRCWSWPPTTA